MESSMTIDFHEINGPKSSKQDNFQELCAQLVMREYPKAKSIEGKGGDGGIDVYIGVSPSEQEVIWQAKLFYDPIKQTQKRQILTSFEKVAKIPSLKKWIICLPHNLNPSEETWLQSIKNSTLKDECNSALIIEWWGESKFRELLAKYRDIADEFFNIAPQINVFNSNNITLDNKRVIIQQAETGTTINIINYPDGIANSPIANVRQMFAEGNDYFAKKMWQDAIEKFESCAALENDLQRLSALNLLIGNCHYRLKKYLTATEFYLKSLRYAKKVPNKQAQAFALANIGYAYSLRTASNATNRVKNIHCSVKYLREALQLLNKHENAAQYAGIKDCLASDYMYLPSKTNKERDRNVRTSIKYCLEALEIYNRNEFPVEYAGTQNSLGNDYMQKPSRTPEEREQNVRKAIEHYTLSLEVRDKNVDPVSYALTQNNLGNAYRMGPSATPGEHNLNIQKAVEFYQASLQIFSKDEYPRDYGSAQNNLGSAYLELSSTTAEEKEQNVQKAIACHQASLDVYKKDNYPLQYASAENNLGHAYLTSSPAKVEVREQNIRNALKCHLAAFAIYKEGKYLVEQATTQNDLANAYLAYSELPSIPFSDLLENVNKAVECLQMSLKVFRKDRYPIENADARNNLGGAYMHLPSTTIKGRLQHVNKAIVCYHVSIIVWRKDKYPVKNAMVQNNLGGAYLELTSLTSENLVKNMHMSVECYRAALELLRQEEHPIEHASCQDNLAKAYLEFPYSNLEERIQNVRKAVDCYMVILQIYPKIKAPQTYGFVAANTGIALSSINDEKACDWLREAKALKEYLSDALLRRIEEIMSQKCDKNA